jgi:5S rRNA maturation endonuclease (ribonuclease M5)
MYGYKEKRVFISKEEILEKVSQEEIFKFIVGYLPREHQYVFSLFRKDKSPNCYYEWYKDCLWFVDWSEPENKKQHRDCFNMVQDHFKVSFYKALEIVNGHFKLGLGAGHHEDSEFVVKQRKIIEETEQQKKNTHLMPCKVREFNSQGDRLQWSPYQITRQELIEDNVFPIIWYKVYSKRLRDYVVIRPTTNSYLIGTFEERTKYYTPDKVGKGKWATNCSANDIWGYEDLPLMSDKLIITKSYKDWRVLKNQGVKNVIGFQNEGQYPSLEILKSLLERFKEIIIFFDNDRAGIQAAEKLVEYLNSIIPRKTRSIYLKETLQKQSVSDPADMIKIIGKEPLVNFLLENKLIY